MRNFLMLLLFCVLLSCKTMTPDVVEPKIVPEPLSVQYNLNKYYPLHERPLISAEDISAESAAKFLNNYLNETGWKSEIHDRSELTDIHFQVISGLSEEAYQLQVDHRGVFIQASNEKGFFYGVQTLIQLLTPGKHIASLPYMEIEDEPRFAWRGLHLDVGRHFFSVDFIKKYIDVMAMYKFNTFHWHLTEDQGWRIEIKKYPKLTEIGSQRKETILAKNFDPYIGDGKPYGGYYTQEEIKEVVAYAAERQVNIVPEIEMPGHSLAALAAYPELGCGPGPYEVGTRWGVYDDIYCPKEETFDFLEDVLIEVMNLFPSEYIHIGGDEAPKAVWKKSAIAQEVIRREGLKDEFELQSYFIKRIEKFLNANGRQLIGWDEILEGGLAPGAAVMSWRGEAGGIEAAEAGHKVVMTPNGNMYFDHYQADPKTEPLAIGGFTDLKSVYDYEPIPEQLEEAYHEYVMGAQANVWTEYMKTSDYVEYMVYPRAVALAETVWSAKKNRNWEHFQEKLPHQYRLLDAKNVNYHIQKPNGLSNALTLDEQVTITLNSPYDNSQIYYTTDGTQPSETSSMYEGPIALEISSPVTVKAITILEGGSSSPVAEAIYQQAELLDAIQPLKADPGLEAFLLPGSFNTVEQIQVNGQAKIVSEIALPEVQPAQFGMIFRGMISIPKDGIYTFFTTSDDGSVLSIADQLVVNNDGLHGPQEAYGQIALKVGYHNIEVKYFEGGGGEGLKVEMEGPGRKRSEIPSSFLYH